mmetsp:Transcript_18947/g.47013  ORF Transcript_18947/g.47013 Transcript_18947/m.47013 type:complete len:133 (+) Transcript_18947:443-841(+)|eukprot:CAMPEP_0116110286 /NCGR_PEP_ID=MMETSP0327-20121206/17822_1 /TAXON_ID=44447 /ORGANISM="Pseudo-nitzschia delicatissima, Strain B596" /LENGTH=132 /DNA_ID=CAMNT_0003603423 /DNA_START=401 /DNA_END=799 /DNA_ORIENTATION=+
MAYESQHYDVTEYPKLFQNWTANNLDHVLDQFQLLKFHVSSVDAPKLIFLSTLEPPCQPTGIKSGSFPSPDLIPSAASRVDDEPDLSLEPTEISSGCSNACSNIKVIAVIGSVYAVGAIVFVALYIYQKSME